MQPGVDFQAGLAMKRAGCPTFFDYESLSLVSL
jgi:hypothetical protein